MSGAERDAADLVETMLRLDDHSPASSYHRDADDEDPAPGASQLGSLPRYVRDWAAGDSASASGGRRWPIDSLEHALELELDIQEADMRAAQAEQHAQQAEMHVHLLQEANASLASERSTLLQRAVTAERALGTEREALVHRALTAEQATCALMEQHARDAGASSAIFDTRLARLEEELAAERARHEKEAQEHGKIKEWASQLQAECGELSGRVEGLQEELQLSRRSAEQLRRDREAAEAALQASREEAESLRTDLGRTNFRLGDMQEMLHRLQASVDEEATARLAAEESAALASGQLLSMRERLQQAEAAARQEAERAERGAEHAEHASQQLAQAQAAQQHALAAQAKLQAGIEEARGQIGPATERAHQAEEEMDAAQTALHDALAAQGHLQAAVDTARDEAVAAKERLRDALGDAQREAQRAEHAEEQRRLAEALAAQSQADATAAQHARLAAESHLEEAVQSNKELSAALQHVEQDRAAQTARLSAQLQEAHAAAERAAAAAAAAHASAYADLEERVYRDKRQVEVAKDRELDDVLQQMQRLKEDAASELRSGKEQEASLAADVRKVESKLAEEQSAAQAAAEEAASRLLGVEQAATEDKERLQQQLALLEQKLSEASAVQDDLATRLQESKSLCHQAVERQLNSFQEVSVLKQQMSDLQVTVLQPLQAEHGAARAALSTLTQLCAEWVPAESPQPADRAHLMAPAVHHAAASTSSRSAIESAHSTRSDTPSDAPGGALGTPMDAHKAAEGAVKAVQQMLSQAQGERAALLQARHLAEAQQDEIGARSAAAHREYQAALQDMQLSMQSAQDQAADAKAQGQQIAEQLELEVQRLQVLREEARVAQAAEVEELSAERDALLEKSKAQHAQCLQHLAESQALRQELAAAYEGKHLEEMRHSEAEAAHERALAFAREESDQALALVCADLAALQSAATACTAVLASALAGVSSKGSDEWTADWSLDLVPSQGPDPVEEIKQAGSSSSSAEAQVKGSEEAARFLKHCTETAAQCIERLFSGAKALKLGNSDLKSRLNSALDDCHKAQQHVQLQTEQLAQSAAERSEQAERLKQDFDEQHSSLQQQLDDSGKLASALETSQVQLQARLSMLQQESAALQDAHKALEQAHAGLQDQMQAARKSAESLQAELETGAAARQALQDELAQATASLQTERLLRTQAQEELAAVRQAGADLERQLDIANNREAKVGELKKALQEAEGAAEQLQDRADAAEDALAEGRADLARQTATNKALLAKLAASRAAAQQTAAILKVARTEAEDLQACLQHEQEQVRRLEMLCEAERETLPEEAQRQLADAGLALTKALEECRAVLRQNRQMQADKDAALLEKEAAKQQAAHLQRAIEGLTKPRIKAIHAPMGSANDYEMPLAKEQLRECTGCSAKSARICELRKALAAALDGHDTGTKEDRDGGDS